MPSRTSHEFLTTEGKGFEAIARMYFVPKHPSGVERTLVAEFLRGLADAIDTPPAQG